jgi:hypothetical protein
LTESDFLAMQQRLEDLDRADLLIAQAIQGGIDMSEQSRSSRELRERLVRLKAAFFPGR